MVRHPTFRLAISVERGVGFIELLVVLILLASLRMAPDRTSLIHSHEAVLKEDLFRIREAIDQYYADRGQYPRTLDTLVGDSYLRKIPADPFTNSARSWRALPANPDPNNPTAEPGVYDVKSGADGTALDGTKYSEW